MSEQRITMKRRLQYFHLLTAAMALVLNSKAKAFSPSMPFLSKGWHWKWSSSMMSQRCCSCPSSVQTNSATTMTTLFAKPKDSKAAALAALEALDLVEEEEEKLSKKELMERTKASAKKKSSDHQQGGPDATPKSKKDLKASALENLDNLDLDDDAPLSKKEQMELQKAAGASKKKNGPQAQAEEDVMGHQHVNDKNGSHDSKPMSKKEAALMRALEMEERDAVADVQKGDLDEPKLSKKELKAQQKKEEKMLAKKMKKQQARRDDNEDDDDEEDDDDDDKDDNNDEQSVELRHEISESDGTVVDTETILEVGVKALQPSDTSAKPPMSKKEAALQRALEMEERDLAATEAQSNDFDEPKLSKKELKALQKKEEKMAAKKMKKQAQKEEEKDGGDDDDDDEQADGDDDPTASGQSPGDVDGDLSLDIDEDEETEILEDGVTLEDKIRKERPPPRIRVMESSQPGYTSLRLENVGITFRNQVVLKDVTWGVQTGDRIGLVGANGAGKTTQLRILAGELEPTTGDVVKSSKDLRVAMLRQEFIDELDLTRKLREEFFAVFEEENQILQELRDCEVELERLGTTDDTDKMQDILDRMQDLQNKADNKGVYALESRVQKVMNLMGFTDDEADDLVSSFSGGWKMRIGLGKVLLKDPNVLLLDEPTNHLDLESVEWMEEFLRQQKIPLIIVSHDREFLDQVCTKIVDAEGGMCTEYDGNYSRFLQLKKARMDAWQAAFDAQEKKLKEEKAWINQFKLKQPQAVQQRQSKLEKFLKSDEYVKKPPFVGKPFRFRFPDAPRLSPEVAEVKQMSHSYRNGATINRLFDDSELFIGKGDRIAVVGPNGSGKSTLLRLLTSRENPDEGTAHIVGANVVMNYFEQNQADALDLGKTVLETIQTASNTQSYNELRALLGQFLFKGDSVDKKVVNLSGGEKARLSLCCMMLRPANLLILDEPTNHLDIPAKEMLEEALQHFAGSVIVVSHDRYFVSKVATTIVAIEEKKLIRYEGDYKAYMESKRDIMEKIEARYVQGVKRIEAAPVIDLEAAIQKAKGNFGGAKTANMVSRKDKGIKNAKRMQVS